MSNSQPKILGRTLSSVTEEKPIRMMIVGDPGSGKTQSLVSLIQEGYKLWIMDLDNGTDIIAHILKERYPELLNTVRIARPMQSRPFSLHKTIAQANPKLTAANAAVIMSDWIKHMDWKQGDVFVLDTLSFFGAACLEWAEATLGEQKDNRRSYAKAMKKITEIFTTLCSPKFPAHCIILSHIQYEKKLVKNDRTVEEVISKAYPASLGKALNLRLDAFLNDIYIMDKYKIYTKGGSYYKAKTSHPLTLKPSYPSAEGLAEIFSVLGATPAVHQEKGKPDA